MAYQYDDEVKSRILARLADPFQPTTVQALSIEYGINRHTISRWKQTAGITPLLSDADSEALGRLVVQHIRESLETRSAQEVVLVDRKWLEKQSASGLAELREKEARVLFQLLELVNSGPDEADEED